MEREIVDLQRQILQTKAARAREIPISDKIMLGPRLFDQVCERMRDGIRAQFPEYDAAAVEAELRRQLKIKRKLDERGFYVDAGTIDDE